MSVSKYAFPYESPKPGGEDILPGMTYREYVAAGVMAAFGVRDDHKTYADAAMGAVRMADALIAELEKHQEKL